MHRRHARRRQLGEPPRCSRWLLHVAMMINGHQQAQQLGNQAAGWAAVPAMRRGGRTAISSCSFFLSSSLLAFSSACRAG